MQSYQTRKTFCNHIGMVTSVNFSWAGEFLISCGADDTLNVYDCVLGNHVKTIPSKKYGCTGAIFSNTNQEALYCSVKENDDIRLVNVESQQFVRYFKGHTSRVHGLSKSPTTNLFLSSSQDESIRIWDTRSANCQGIVRIRAAAKGSFDPLGQVIAVAIASEQPCIKLMDIRQYEKVPWFFLDSFSPI